MKLAFNVFDSNRKGYIDENDLLRICDSLNWDEKVNVKEILTAMDKNKDGLVTIEGKHKNNNNKA